MLLAKKATQRTARDRAITDRRELCRTSQDIPPQVVTMNSTVRFSMVETGKEFCLTLVYPRDMDSSADKLSILRPLAALCWACRWVMSWRGQGLVANR